MKEIELLLRKVNELELDRSENIDIALGRYEIPHGYFKILKKIIKNKWQKR